MKNKWNTMIAHVDMDAFFAACEQQVHPEFIGRPIAITAGPHSRAITCASYEARAFGAKAGGRIQHPDIHYIPANMETYKAFSLAIMSCLREHISPDIEEFSIDEAFICLTGSLHLYSNEKSIIQHIQSVVHQQTGLTCSVGIGENKVLAKVASKVNKPNGYYIVPPGEGANYLADKPIDILCGIGPKMKKRLNQYGIFVCRDIKKIPISMLSGQFGQIGRQIWWMCLGIGPTSIQEKKDNPKRIGKSKCLAWRTYSQSEIQSLFYQLIKQLTMKLRQKKRVAQHFKVILCGQHTIIEHTLKTEIAIDTSQPLNQNLQKVILTQIHWPIHIRLIGIFALDPTTIQQTDLFTPKQKSPDLVIDQIKRSIGPVIVDHFGH